MKLQKTQAQALIGTSAAADMLGVSPDTIRRWAKDGRVAASSLPSGRLRFRPEDIEALLTPTTESADEAAQNESSRPVSPDDFLPGLEEMGS